MSTRKGWFSYSFVNSLETHATAEEAEGKARRMLASEEEYARKEGEWDDNATSIFWGQIHGSIVTTKHDTEEDDPPVSYHLRPPDPCTADPVQPTDVPIPRLPGAAEYEARATSREDDRAQLCDALGLPGLTWDEALAEVRRRGGAGEEGKRRES